MYINTFNIVYNTFDFRAGIGNGNQSIKCIIVYLYFNTYL